MPQHEAERSDVKWNPILRWYTHKEKSINNSNFIMGEWKRKREGEKVLLIYTINLRSVIIENYASFIYLNKVRI